MYIVAAPVGHICFSHVMRISDNQDLSNQRRDALKRGLQGKKNLKPLAGATDNKNK